VPTAIIIAGPNGAGKTTFAQEFLPKEGRVFEFINADLIAAGLSPFRPGSADVMAGRIMLVRLRELAESGADFAVETTLSGSWLSRAIHR
jgi:predicted ABC-type ATPase